MISDRVPTFVTLLLKIVTKPSVGEVWVSSTYLLAVTAKVV